MSDFNPWAVLAELEAEGAKAAKAAKPGDGVSNFSGISKPSAPDGRGNRGRSRAEGQTGEPLAPVTRQVLGMPLSHFAKAGLRLVVYSELLGERVIFASDNARLPPSDRERMVYRAAELRELLGLGPEELRRVHLVKRTFKGVVEPARAPLACSRSAAPAGFLPRRESGR